MNRFLTVSVSNTDLEITLLTQVLVFLVVQHIVVVVLELVGGIVSRSWHQLVLLAQKDVTLILTGSI